MREIKIAKNDAGQRLDKFLTKALDLPVGLLYKSIRTKKIKVNRKRAENNTVLMEGDTIQCFLAEEFFGKLEGACILQSFIKGEDANRFDGASVLCRVDREGIPCREHISCAGINVGVDGVAREGGIA